MASDQFRTDRAGKLQVELADTALLICRGADPSCRRRVAVRSVGLRVPRERQQEPATLGLTKIRIHDPVVDGSLELAGIVTLRMYV